MQRLLRLMHSLLRIGLRVVQGRRGLLLGLRVLASQRQRRGRRWEPTEGASRRARRLGGFLRRKK
jgi:hypothetical protein